MLNDSVPENKICSCEQQIQKNWKAPVLHSRSMFPGYSYNTLDLTSGDCTSKTEIDSPPTCDSTEDILYILHLVFMWLAVVMLRSRWVSHRTLVIMPLG